MPDFPGGPVVKNPSANAGDMGLIPGPGRFHMPVSCQLLSLRSEARALQHEKPPQLESIPHSRQLEKACAQQSQYCQKYLQKRIEVPSCRVSPDSCNLHFFVTQVPDLSFDFRGMPLQ